MDINEIRKRLEAARGEALAAEKAYDKAIKTRGDKGAVDQAEAYLIAEQRADRIAGEFEAAVRDAVNRGELTVERGDGSGSRDDERDRKGRSRRPAGDVRDTAIRSLERVADEQRSGPVDTKVVERYVGAIEKDTTDLSARYVEAASDEDYLGAFRKYANDPERGHLLWDDREHEAWRKAEAVRATLTDTSGSALLPIHLDPNIILTNTGVAGDFRSFSRVETLPVGNTYNAVTTANGSAEWVAENTQVSDATPTPATKAVPVYKGDAYFQYTIEFAQDSKDWEQQVTKLLADAKQRLEQTAFAVGTGGTQPTGIVTALQAVTASRVNATTNGSFGAPDVFALLQALPARWWDQDRGASWLSNQTFGVEIRKFALASGNVSSAFWADLGTREPPTLLGYPVHHASGMQATPLSAATASNDDILVVGNFNQYLIADRLGATVEFVPTVLGANQRPIGARGIVLWFRTGADVLVPDAFRMLRV